jgi:tRNA 2-thiocytidine biosynthesis protein TtcA
VYLIKDKLYSRIKRLTGKAIGDFNLIENGDKILIGVSGGKDSYTLLHVLESLRKRAPIDFELFPVTVDSGFPGFRKEIIEEHLKKQGFNYLIKKTSCYQIIEEKRDPGSSYCSFCARLRRGVIYSTADKLGCNKIALGHHLDDFIETLLLNQFYNGKLSAMSPKLLADNNRHTVIRPLVYVEEEEIIAFTSRNNFPVICCACPVCGRVEQKRKKTKALLKNLSQDNPSIKKSLLSSLKNIKPRHLMDKSLKNF